MPLVIDAMRGFNAGKLDAPAVWRTLRGHPQWHVAVDQDGRGVLWTFGNENYLIAMLEPRWPLDSPGPMRVMSGSELIGFLPAQAHGVAFELGHAHAIRLTRRQLAQTFA